MVKIIDYFTFFAPTGKEMLELRIKMLNDYVDQFIICESNKTQSGLPIEYELESVLEELGLMSDKIRIIKLHIPNDEDLQSNEIDAMNCYESNSTNKNSILSRTRERMQKDALLSVIDEYDNDTVFIHSDIDEIIKPEAIHYVADVARKNKGVVLRIPLVYLEGRADLRVYMKDTDTPKEWTGMFVATRRHLKIATPTQIRSNARNPLSIVFLTEGGNRLEDLGWHFSWMGDSKKRKIKSVSFTHYDDTFISVSHKFNSKEMEEFQENVEIKEGSIPPSGDTNGILKKYPIENLPSQIFESERIRNFLLPKTIEEMNINELTLLYSTDTENPEYNYRLALSFFEKGHTPSAQNFFLRAAELTDDNDLIYRSLLYCAMCLHIQKERPHSVKGFLLHAISISPERPEAWYQYIKFFRENNDWQECLSFSVSCLANCNFNLPLLDWTDYRGKWSFVIFKLVCSYQAGRFEETKKSVIELVVNHWNDLSEEEKTITKEHMQNLKMVPDWISKIINC